MLDTQTKQLKRNQFGFMRLSATKKRKAAQNEGSVARHFYRDAQRLR